MAASASVLRERLETIENSVSHSISVKFDELTEGDSYQGLKLKKSHRDDLPGKVKFLFMDASNELIMGNNRTNQYNLNMLSTASKVDLLQALELGWYKVVKR